MIPVHKGDDRGREGVEARICQVISWIVPAISLKKQQYMDDSSAHTREMKRAKAEHGNTSRQCP